MATSVNVSTSGYSPFDRRSQTPAGFYTRTRVDPNTADTALRALAIDPNYGGGTRVWFIGNAFGQIGWSDNGGTTFNPKSVRPDSSLSLISLVFSANYVWMVCTGAGNKIGKVYRSPLPDALGNGLVWTAVFDLSTTAGGANSMFRNQNLAVSEPYCYLVEYSAAPVTGGPSIYVSTDTGANWTLVKTFTGGKHIHAVQVLNGIPWVTVGDGGQDAAYPDIGLYTATSAAGTAWNRRSLYGPANNGTYEYGINLQPVTIDGAGAWLLEYDGYGPAGILMHGTQDPTTVRPTRKLFTIDSQCGSSMRQLTISTKGTGVGNAYFVATCESGVLGTYDSIWMSRPPYHTAHQLEIISNTAYLGTLGDPVEENDYIWFGQERVRKELYLNQVHT